MVAETVPIHERREVRCPKCRRLQFVVITLGTAVIESRCRCGQTFVIDTSTGAVLSAYMDNKLAQVYPPE